MKDNIFLNGIAGMRSRTGYSSAPQYTESSVEGVSSLAKRIYAAGGRTQQERMIRDKRRSLDKAVLYSYQGAFVKKVFPAEEEVAEKLRNQPPVRALINPDKTKQDYDDKIISIGYEHEFKPGDVFEWKNTDSYWIIYLEDKTELAYFRGEIRRCRYTISFKDSADNVHTVHAAVRGPVETVINYIQKAGISVDRPNHSVNFLIPLNDYTLDYFRRYSKFYLLEDDRKICWRTEAIDWISMPGIIQVNAIEYYANEFQDDIDQGLAGGLIVKPENPNSNRVDHLITGETFIKPKGEYEYKYTGLVEASWSVDPKYPVTYEIIDNRTIKVKWQPGYSGQFEIQYGDITKTIVVESLF